MCVRAKKNKRDFFFFSSEAYKRIIVIDLIIVKLFGVCPIVFSLQRERVFHVNICIFVYDSYFGLLMFVIILFRTQHLGIKECLRICVRLEVVLCVTIIYISIIYE